MLFQSKKEDPYPWESTRISTSPGSASVMDRERDGVRTPGVDAMALLAREAGSHATIVDSTVDNTGRATI